jgi:GNAT superfamily N-acetyltransferase
MSDFAISLLESEDISEAIQVLTDAMLSVPLHVAVFQGRDEAARRELWQMSAELLRHPPGMICVAKLDEQIVGVMHMKLCFGRGPSSQEADETTLQNTASRVAHWQNAWARRDPPEPHWHLGPVGVLPQCQGSGIGTALLQHFCREVDARKAAAYFETDRPWLVPFCQRFGFQVVDDADIFGVKNYFLWRSPSP